MKGMEDETSRWSDAFETDKGAVFIDLPLTVTIKGDLSPLNSTPAQVRAVMHRERFGLHKLWRSSGLGHP